MSSELDSLLSVITNGVREIQAIYTAKNMTIPSIDDPNSSLGLEADLRVMHSTDIAIAAAKRLITTLSNPNNVAIGVAFQMYGSSALNVALEANLTEALKEADPEGMHVDELGPKVGMEPSKLARILRYLCAMHHMYREVSPDRFANNRISMSLDTGKSFDQVKDRNDPFRWKDSKGMSAFAGHITDEMMKGATHLPEILLSPETAHSFEPSQTSLMKAFGFDGIWWDCFDQPGQQKRFHRYGEAMRNLNELFPRELILSRYPWGTIPDGSVVVDVGGGIGGTTHHLARTFPNLRYILQDRAPVIADAEKSWRCIFPEAIESGLVTLRCHNFFQPQPVKGAAVYILQFVLHTWPDAEALKILHQIRPAMAPDSKVVIIDLITPYACPVEDDVATGKIPEVLRGNLAPDLGFTYYADMQVMNAINAQERTVEHWRKLVSVAGLRIETITPSHLFGIVCTPA